MTGTNLSRRMLMRGADVTAAQKIFISGARKHMDDWVRLSFGTPAEMQAFKIAFAKIMA
jgi:histidinol-phosphate aminotransferase